MQFGIRSLLVLTTALAVCLAIVIAYPVWDVPMFALLLAVAMAIVVIGFTEFVFKAEDWVRQRLARRRK